MKTWILALTACAAAYASQSHAATFVNNLAVPNGVDLSGFSDGVNGNRLGGFGSDLIYDAATGTYFGLTDRGPGGGLLSYAPRIQQFSVTTDPMTGAVSNFSLVNTIVFRNTDGSTFNGLNPTLLNGSASKLGASFDSEGLVRLKNGNFLVSDEYGPSVYEFDTLGTFVRAFTTPDNLVPKVNPTTPNYTDGRPTITTGRQDNRGFEGLTLSEDGTKAYAILQDPLVNEGSNNDGRRSQNVRIVEFDVGTGEATNQYVYQLDSIASINAGLPSDTFSPTNQGRSIGASSIVMLPNGQMIVLERDNRGVGVDPATQLPIGSKKLYLIDTTGATDVSGISLAGSNLLPSGVTPVSKTSFLDIQAALQAAGFYVPEKIEGLAFGPWLADGGLSLLVITDNDFSVTQDTTTTVQSDVCISNTGVPGAVREEITLDAGCSAGFSSIPTNIYAFKLSAAEARALGFVQSAAVPEPATWAMMIVGFGLAGAAMRRRKVAVRFA